MPRPRLVFLASSMPPFILPFGVWKGSVKRQAAIQHDCNKSAPCTAASDESSPVFSLAPRLRHAPPSSFKCPFCVDCRDVRVCRACGACSADPAKVSVLPLFAIYAHSGTGGTAVNCVAQQAHHMIPNKLCCVLKSDLWRMPVCSPHRRDVIYMITSEL